VNNPPTNRVWARLPDVACPQCCARGGLGVVSRMQAKPVELPARKQGLHLIVAWRPVLVCDGCDLYEVGVYTHDGQEAVWDDTEGADGADDEPVRTAYPRP
jgi:hypothetical protein